MKVNFFVRCWYHLSVISWLRKLIDRSAASLHWRYQLVCVISEHHRPHPTQTVAYLRLLYFTSGRVRSCEQQIQGQYLDVRLNMTAISRVVSLSRETRSVQDKKKKKEGHHLCWLQIIQLLIMYSGADKFLARPGRKQATATEDFEFHISYL
jgi:hypothetical protein